MKNHSCFYIAHQEAADIVQCDKLRNTKLKEEDIKFLDALKDGKKVVLGSVEKDYSRKLQSYKKRKQSSEKYAKKNVIEQSTQVILEDSGEDEDLNYSDEDKKA